MDYTFYLICPIGLETLALSELEEKLPLVTSTTAQIKTRVLPGGIEVDLPLKAGLLLNYWLRIPSRILVRLKNQTCRDLPKLYSILSKFPWRSWLNQNNIQFKASSSQSRLINTKRITETAQDAFNKYNDGNKLANFHAQKSYPDQSVYLRFKNDQLTISLDSSGEHLHKRGWSTHRGFAGIRENLAFACLYFMTNKSSPTEIYDPMCGSGTFLREFKYRNTPLTRREFNFKYWANCPKLDQPKFVSSDILIYGNDKNTEVTRPLESMVENLTNRDFFELDSIPCPYMIFNPPYGKRVKIDIDPQKYFLKLEDKIKTLNPKIAGVIVPEVYASKLKAQRTLSFNQNGIRVKFLVFEL